MQERKVGNTLVGCMPHAGPFDLIDQNAVLLTESHLQLGLSR